MGIPKGLGCGSWLNADVACFKGSWVGAARKAGGRGAAFWGAARIKGGRGAARVRAGF